MQEEVEATPTWIQHEDEGEGILSGSAWEVVDG